MGSFLGSADSTVLSQWMSTQRPLIACVTFAAVSQRLHRVWVPSAWALAASRVARGLATLLLAAACAATSTSAQDELLVSAAASLTEAFHDIELAFEAAHPGVEVILNLASSSALREQILEGAPAEVYASANLANMEQVESAGELLGEPQTFARNRLQIAVPAGNPAGITGLADFANEKLLIGLCAEGAPCGDFARQALANAGVTPALDTNEPDVRALLTKIEAGELDAGITYVTEVAAAGGAVQGLDIPEQYNLVAEYPIAVLAGARNSQMAAAFVEFVLSADGQAILSDHGFGAP